MAEEERTIVWRLSDDGMGILERAGLAALYMTLRAAEEQSIDLHPLYWTHDDFTASSVTLRWTGNDEDAFRKLFTWAWQVRDGVFYLPAVHREVEQREFAYRRIPTHSGLLCTFLQHPNVQRRASSKETTSLTEQIEEGKQIQVRFRAIKPEEHDIKPIRDLDEVFQRGVFRKTVSLSGWVTPGVAPRYGAELDAPKAWQGSAARAILLMMAPIACLFLRLRGRGVKPKGKPQAKKPKKRLGTNWIFVVPEILDLSEFDDDRVALVLTPDAVDVSSLGDAALRFAARLATRSVGPRTCLVVAMGQLSFYNPGQHVRKAVLQAKLPSRAVQRYRHLMRALPNSLIKVRANEPHVGEIDGYEDPGESTREERNDRFYAFRIPSGRGRIANNLILMKPWYTDLCLPLEWDLDALEIQREREKERDRQNKSATESLSRERLWFRDICFQRRHLMELIEESEMWDNNEERRFIAAFWSALASLYAQEARAVERGGSRKVSDRWDDLVEDIRRSLMRAKTRVLLRGYLVELFAKGGRQADVIQNRATIWNLIDHPYDWKKARDLALLALVTYPSRTKRDQAQTSSTETSDEGGQHE